ncbi:aldo/keto reductase [Opitutus sp. GAS368]|uniref:aldo/keto reductase n=1 Tax=Opitutus sp. GAS368 TaxID=1882749 RepID=UPI00087AFA7A|nr:aldo/keto reductase [Opitutus sp. GAS368]SDS49586.1 Predicted oxidoreductase [Opitutus sp. GAS368]
MKPFVLHPSTPAVSPICLGSSTFGREIGQAAAFALMDRAQARGITLFDTAATYSAGASEQIVGAWLASRRPAPGSLTVATKIYPPFAPEAIDSAVTASAGRLGVETIDLLYLHKWDPAAATPAALTALDRLVRAGRVRALGASNFTAAQLQNALHVQAQLRLTPFRAVQNVNNLAVSEVDAPLLTLCATHEVAIVTYSPLGAGFLTGKHRQGVQPGSRFDVAPGHQAIYFQPGPERRLAHLAAVSARTGHPMPHLALAWALHRPGVASVLIGGRDPIHLDQGLAALALNDSALFADLESA